jgi:hypothetical protein
MARLSGRQPPAYAASVIARAQRTTGNAVAISDSVTRHLKELAAKMSGSVEVGFLEGATYPDGTPVAAVAFWNEYGNDFTPPRPFFRTMIAKESPSWGPKLAGALKATGDGDKALALMGEDIQGALIQSINDFTTPALAPSTIAAKGFDKPLIDTGHMVNSTSYRVVK